MSDASRARLFGNLDELAATLRLAVDRPAGSRHPRVPQVAYPVGYGYLIDCTAEEIGRVRRLLDAVLRIGGLLVRRNLETATGSDSPTAGEKPGAQTWQQRGR